MGATDLALDAFDLEPDEVRSRFEWALRQGMPRWPWPDLPTDAVQTARDAICTVIAEVLAAGHARTRLEGDPRTAGIAGYVSGSGPLLGYWISQGQVKASPDIEALFLLHLRHNRLRMQAMAARSQLVVQALLDAGVEVAVLKGMQTAFECFPEPGTRALSDLDVLVAPRDSAKAAAALGGIGLRLELECGDPPQQSWVPSGERREPWTLEFMHRDDPWSVDLQFSLNRKHSIRAPFAALDEAIGRRAYVSWPLQSGARQLAQPALLLHLANHASIPLGSLTLIRLVELVLVIRRDSGSGALAWPELVALAKKARALGSIYPAMRMCERLAPGSVPQAVLAACEADAPPAVRRFVDRLSPSSASGLGRCSIEERFMWTPSVWARAREVAHDLLPPGVSLATLASIYRMRAWRLARGTVTR